VRTDRGDDIHCRFYVMATGCLSLPKAPDIEGTERFQGEAYYTFRWPHHPVDFSGKRVAVIGTGSSAVQSIPVIARQAAALTVFQRTPNYSRPAKNGPVSAEKQTRFDSDPAAYREAARQSSAGVPRELPLRRALDVSEAERLAAYEGAYQSGDLLALGGTFLDIGADPAANDTVCEFMRGKIRSIVRDPETAAALCPTNHFYGTKRPCIDTDYYETYNLPHVRLVDLRADPIRTITETGIDTASRSFEFDAIVYATGFDAMTGALVAVDIRGRKGSPLKDKWADGPRTYLGLMTRASQPLHRHRSRQPVGIVEHGGVDRAARRLDRRLPRRHARGRAGDDRTDRGRRGGLGPARQRLRRHHPSRARTPGYMGANVPGKPRVFLPYIGGVDRYRTVCDEVVRHDYLGFAFDGPSSARCTDGVIRRVQPDAAIMLELAAELGPPLETLSVPDARALMVALAAERPRGPAVGDVVDGHLPGAAEPLAYRLYRPHGGGPHPIVVYFHGGGWVLGSHDSDDPFCRDLCVRSSAIVISVDYRHARGALPGGRRRRLRRRSLDRDQRPGAGGEPEQLAVCGWSAGGNLAAGVCQAASDAGGPHIAGQVLVTPVTDCDFTRDSYAANGDGYGLTAALMRWFWDHYADEAARTDPKASPLRATDLSGLPPALVVP
jgi:acetyl esterase/lipase